MSTDTFLPYEGAGFLLHYNENFVMGVRIKKAGDLVKDPITEVEYMGGKPEPTDNNDPLQTAYNELVEEVGTVILEADWKSRITPLHTFQPFSKKWIWCILLKLTKAEYANLMITDMSTDSWPISETRDFSALTGRPEYVRKAISAFVQVSSVRMLSYVSQFRDLPGTDNRMKDAKLFQTSRDPLHLTRLSTGQVYELPLRAFNLVIMEKHAETIYKALQGI